MTKTAWLGGSNTDDAREAALIFFSGISNNHFDVVCSDVDSSDDIASHNKREI
jgi:hypothetical protein